jgi:hypothetical protein
MNTNQQENNTMNLDTRTYSQLIAGEVLAVETLLEGRPKYYFDDEPDDEVIAYRAALNELELPQDYDPADILADYLNNYALEVTWLATNSSRDDYKKTRAEILRTCGGPRCEIIRDSTDGQIIEVNTYDAGQPVDSVRVWAPALAAALDDLAAEMGPQ